MKVASVRMAKDQIEWIDEQVRINKLSSRSKYVQQLIKEKMMLSHMRVCIFVDQKMALIAGNDKFGNIIIPFDPADLSVKERQELAMQVNKEEGYFDATCIKRKRQRDHYFPKAEATLESLKEILKERAEFRKNEKL